MAIPSSGTFTGSAGALAEPPWSNTDSRPLSINGSGKCGVTDGFFTASVWIDDSYPADQFSELVVDSGVSSHVENGVSLIVRAQGTDGNVSCYNAFVSNNSDTAIDIVDAIGGFTDVARDNGVGLADGDIVRLTVVGDLLILSINGVEVLSGTDATFTSGNPGFGLVSPDESLLVDSWNADAATGTDPPGVHTVSGRGSFAVTSPAWLSTVITDRPARLSNGAAEPTNWYHVGMLSWGTENGAMVAYPVSRDFDLVQLPAGMTTVWYEFESGASAVITELSAP